MTPLAQHLLAALERHARGRARAVKADVLASILATNWRHIEKAVEELRNSGVFVASARSGNPRGLYLPLTESERADALGSFRRATLSQITTYNALKRARRIAVRSAGQGRLFDPSDPPDPSDSSLLAGAAKCSN